MDSVYQYVPPSLIRMTVVPEATDEGPYGTRLVFNTSSLAYTCLKGSMYMLHKSMSHFPLIIKNTLSDGYGVQLRIKRFDGNGQDGKEVEEMAKGFKRKVKESDAAMAQEAIEAARAHPMLTSTQYGALKARQACQAEKDHLSRLEMQQQWEYYMAIILYELRPSKVDAEFLAEYVGAYCSASSEKSMMEQFRKLSRFGHAHTSTPAQLQKYYDAPKEAMNLSDNADITKALGKVHDFWPPTIAVCELLDMVAPDWRSKVSDELGRNNDDSEPIRFTSKAGALGLLKWASNMNDDKYAKMLSTLGIKPRKDHPTRTRGLLLKYLHALDDEGEEAVAPGVCSDERVPQGTPRKGRKAKAPAAAASASSTPPATAAAAVGGVAASSAASFTPRGKVRSSSTFFKSLIESAFGIKCIVGDGVISLDVEAFTYMRKRRSAPFSTYMFDDTAEDDLEPKPMP